ncbi:MAG: histidine kinase [Pyrinomonadaceae bacterium]|nr:histidine kinase [Pyrinomonadaceae bacterium]
MLQRSWKWWSLIFGGWTLFGIFFACQAYLNNAYFGRPLSFGRTLVVWLSCVYIWAVLTPLIIRLARQFPIERGTYLRGLTVHLLAGTLVSLLQLGIYIFVRQWLLGDPSKSFSPLKSFQNIFVAEFHANLLLYWSVVGLSHAYEYYRRYRERERRAAQLELEASRLETQLARAQLDALRMQLHPHFLFNTLNTISVLMKEDTAVADRMLLRLSELLRLTLKNTNSHEVSLRQELEFLSSYLEIEQTRFQDRLQVQMNIDPDALDAQVPHLILQPLVENAIRYAVAPSATRSTVEICAARLNGHIELQVRDDGSGIDEANQTAAHGVGLKNTRARLEKLYGAAQRFQLSSVAGGGLQVTITIPFHTATDGVEESSHGEDPRTDR